MQIKRLLDDHEVVLLEIQCLTLRDAFVRL